MKRLTMILTILILLITAYYSGAQQAQPSDLQQVWQDIKGRTGTLDTDRSWAIFVVQIDPDAKDKDVLTDVGRDFVVIRTQRDKKYSHVFIPFNQIRLVQRN